VYLQGLETMGVGAVMFVIFGSFFNAFNAGWTLYLPLVLILVGIYVLIRNFVRK
jgi:hypothetical protein